MIPPLSSFTSSPPSTSSQPGGPTLGKQDFLRLLITQLRNQDPLNPLDQNQFLAQTAQFTSLENLQNISTQLAEMKSLAQSQAVTQGASLLGKTATSMGRDVTLQTSGATLPFLATTPGPVQLQIVDGQNALLRTLSTIVETPGAYTVAWDGLNTAGESVAPGTYHYRVVPQGGTVAMAAQGTLSGMTPSTNGLVYHIGDAIVRADDLISIG
jgi:flagellar basal-body rod modification protein FlgD